MKSMAFCGEKKRDYKVCVKNVVQYSTLLSTIYKTNFKRLLFYVCLHMWM